MLKNPWVLVGEAACKGLGALWLPAHPRMQLDQRAAQVVTGVGGLAAADLVDRRLAATHFGGNLVFAQPMGFEV